MQIIEIKPQKTIKKVCILLHGLGANGHDLLPIANALFDLETTLVYAPTANSIPISLYQNEVMCGWYDILGLDRNSQIDICGIEQSIAQIHNLYKKSI